jgi:ubiquinone/menaquinone biosynthesis C-methylase UbiE
MTDVRRFRLKRPKGSSTEQKESWKETYEKRDYRELPWFSEEPSEWLQEARRSGWIKPPARSLDIGCGAGTNVLWMAREGFDATGVDLAPGAVDAASKRARSENSKARFVNGDALNLPFADRSFDVATDFGCFHTLPIKRRHDYAKELARVLAPHGTYIVTWVAREVDGEQGPPHRPSLLEVTQAFEELFLFRRAAFLTPRSEGLASYGACLSLRERPQPPPR